uniref:Dl_5 protein n=1 Tax=Fopius arisanus TaxID=64838 RepID=A0A0C9Q428_9HYME
MDVKTPWVEVIEQPASKEFRFRYECERRSHGSIPGVHSTSSNKTYPKIKIVGLQTDAHVIVSCVSKEAPYKVHPHRLISKGKEINHGVFTITAGPDTNEIELKNLGIQCVRKRDIKKSLEERKRVRVDPFQQGYDHGDHPVLIDLNVVRLCFQVFLYDRDTEKYTKKLTPIVSDPIYDKQTVSNLSISKLSTEMALAVGGTSLTIFGQKIIKEDIKVRFFEIQEDKVVWEASEDSLPRNNHDNQTTITIKTPAYPLKETDDCVHLMVQLTKPSTGEAGKAIPFTFVAPGCFNAEIMSSPMDLSSKRKRKVVKRCNSFESIRIPSRLLVSNQPESPNTDDSGGITPEEEVPELTPNIPHECFYRTFDTHHSKKPKYSEGPLPLAPGLPHPAMYPPFLINPNLTPMMINSPAYDCLCYPPMIPRYHPFLPLIPQSSPYPFFASTEPTVKDMPQSFREPRNWPIQPKPRRIFHSSVITQ